METEAVAEWSPMRPLARPSPFYALKSIAFAGGVDIGGKVPCVPLTARGAGTSTSRSLTLNAGQGKGASGFLPPLSARGPGDQLGSLSVSGFVGEEEHVAREAAAHEELLLRQPRARRDAALAEYHKAEEQCRLVAERLAKEHRTRAACEAQTQELRQKADALGDTLKIELSSMHEQQKVLRRLRAQVREMQGLHVPTRTLSSPSDASAPAASASVPAPATAGGEPAPSAVVQTTPPSSAQAAPRAIATCVVAPRPPPGASPPRSRTVTAASGEGGPSQSARLAARTSLRKSEPINVDMTLEGLLAEMQQIKLAFTGSRPAAECGSASSGTFMTAAGGGKLGATRGSGGASENQRWQDCDEEAEIEVIRSGGCGPAARMRHPSGAEAFVDLRSGCLRSWQRADGLLAGEGSIPLLWPSILDAAAPQGASPRGLWRLTLMDDSNNEPSVTLSCGGDGSAWPWHIRRTLTLGADVLRERLAIESLAEAGSAPVSFAAPWR
mmetsp:Transcript_45285/g.145143  ORF Transcript_45285/g.145143 Transcript_45285/m.145143 type:complete len:498 (+) Transcript_45285:290-1783(+)